LLKKSQFTQEQGRSSARWDKKKQLSGKKSSLQAVCFTKKEKMNHGRTK